MNGASLRSNLELIFGEHFWKPAQEWLGVDRRTLERQISGAVDVRGPIRAAVEARLEIEARRRNDRERFLRLKMTWPQHEILTGAAAGEHLLARCPEGKPYIGTWEAAILSCQDRGWLDADRKITQAGRDALITHKVRQRKRSKVCSDG